LSRNSPPSDGKLNRLAKVGVLPSKGTPSMRRHLIAELAGVAALAAVAGCAAQHGPPPVTDFGWFYAEDRSEGAKLVYGQDGTDNVTLMLICQPRSGRVVATLPGTPGGPGAVRFVSGSHRVRLAARPLQDEDGVQAELRADDPVLAGFAASGDLAILEGARRTALPVRPAERRLATRFLAACRPA
jgi:hypothetical protein